MQLECDFKACLGDLVRTTLLQTYFMKFLFKVSLDF